MCFVCNLIKFLVLAYMYLCKINVKNPCSVVVRSYALNSDDQGLEYPRHSVQKVYIYLYIEMLLFVTLPI
jgi:hypothetical protein